jgi:hypothetical protein
VEKCGLGELLRRNEVLRCRIRFGIQFAILVAAIAPTITATRSDSDYKLT